MKDEIYDQLISSMLLELRRGTIVLSVLSHLKTPKYGYSLVLVLEENGTPVEAGTLYPLLRRLEKQELLESSWDTDSAKPRKYYVINENGEKVLDRLKEEWDTIVNSINKILYEED